MFTINIEIGNNIIKTAKENFYKNYFQINQSNNVPWKKINQLGVLKDFGNDYNSINPNEHFASIQSILCNVRTDINLPEATDAFNFSEVNVNNVKRALYSVKSNATGIWDGIDEHVTYTFNNILTRSQYPNVWKYSLLTPVDKVSRPMSINDYRPISRFVKLNYVKI